MAFFKNNLNPKKHKTGDCAVRALSAAMNVPWEKAYVLLAQRGLELALDMTDPKVMESVLLENGFKAQSIKVIKGGSRPRVMDIASQFPEYACLCRVANHYVACAYGNYVDTWDSGDKSVYKYWFKHIK